jgi:hypothetical protein
LEVEMQTVDGRAVELSDFGPGGRRALWQLLLLVDRIDTRRRKEAEDMVPSAGRRNEHIIIRRPEKQEGKERGDGKRKGRKQTDRELLRDRRK